MKSKKKNSKRSHVNSIPVFFAEHARVKKYKKDQLKAAKGGLI